MIELEDDKDLFTWYQVLCDLWNQTDWVFDPNLCPYSLPEIERELIRRDNLRGALE